MTAHTLARAVCSSTSHHAFEICPPCIEPTLINDISKVCFSKKRESLEVIMKYPMRDLLIWKISQFNILRISRI